MSAVYQWKPQAHIKIDAQLAGETIEMLRGRLGGQVTPQELLNHARESNNPLHDGFEWDDGKAAEAHRIEQAGHILRCLVVSVKVTEESEPAAVRAFVNVIKAERRGYVSLAHAMSDAEMRAQVVSRAWQELMQWRTKYGEYKELARIALAIDREDEERKK